MEKQIIVAAFNCPNCGAAIAPDSPSCCYCGSSIATRLCPACFAAVSIGMKHCPHCGAEAADSAPKKSGLLRCPRCEAALALIAVGRLSLNTCSRCGGLWVDKTAFQGICMHQEEQEAVLSFQSETSGKSAVQENKSKRAYIPCPECGKLMNHKNFSGSGIVLDWCRDHGSWFDRNELQQIVRFIGDGGLRKAREREKLQLKEQEDRLRMQQFTMASLERHLDSNPGGKLDYSVTGDLLVDFLSKMFQ
jgi:Zn-finger nucleic acid-binding protein